MKQTAVEWLIEQISEKQPNGFYVIDTLEDVKKVFEQAKTMEKEQQKYFFECGRNFQLTGEGTFEQYYTSTFNS